MRFTLERTVEPEFEPVTLAEMKVHLRTFSSDTSEDAEITRLAVTAREWAEDYTGRALIDQTWLLTLDGRQFVTGDTVSGYQSRYGFYRGFYQWLRGNEIYLRKSPALALVSFKTVNDAGVEADVDPATYELRDAGSKWPKIFALNGASWGGGVFRITYRAGYADTTGSPQDTASVVPESYKTAIMFYAESLYDRDPAAAPGLVKAAENMLRPLRADLQIA